ncbi:hypothetical protein DPMN_105718 [Dreissena polymorpha]|uniref:Uncharacterized protein n=1 Tax=Dreissena polymorpha TaxID=45954 RepID=A0A9D4K3N9_DREPO|nr:hypothetical protein DPMN_105718 [Dreissena polymorpha]
MAWGGAICTKLILNACCKCGADYTEVKALRKVDKVCILPTPQLLPVHPVAHTLSEQLPETWSQLAPGKQWQGEEQVLPKNPKIACCNRGADEFSGGHHVSSTRKKKTYCLKGTLW